MIPDLNSGTINSKTWILDSGASKHVCTDKTQMNNMQPLPAAVIMKCANKEVVQLKEMGRVKLKMLVGEKQVPVTLTKVAYAPAFQCNIISVGVLVEAGLKVSFGQRGAIVCDKMGTPIITARKFGNLFIVSTVGATEYAQVVKEENENSRKVESTKGQIELWHQRLGHVSFDGLRKMISKQSVEGIAIDYQSVGGKSSNELIHCVACIKGKQHRHPFNHEWKDKANEVLDRVHADLCGPLSEDRCGNRYLSTIIDEKTRMLFAEPIPSKDRAAEGIMTWCNAARTYHKGKAVIEFHSDGGGEYRGKPLLKYFESQGVKPTSTLPSTPQHNPIAERINRTIFEMARSLLSHCGLPKEFWSDAVNYSIHIRNRCLTTVNNDKSPFEMWTGQKPSVAHIRIFGCDAYMHVKDADRSKLDDKSIECVLIGYSDYNRGYKLYSVHNKKVYYSRDVVFNEKSFQHAARVMKEKESEEAGIQGIDENYFKPLDEIDETAAEQKDIQEKEIGIVEGFDQEEIQVSRPRNVNDPRAQQEEEKESDEAERKEENDAAEPAEQKEDLEVEEPTAKLSKEARALMADRQHAMFEPPRNRRRNAARIDRGAVITDSEQLRHYTNAITDVDVDYCFASSIYEPSSYSEAMKSEDAEKWKEATNKEYQSLIDKNTWTKCKLPKDRQAIGCKWVYRVKLNKNGEVERYKARLVAKGYSQKEGIDYNETFAPVLKYKSLRILLSIAAIKDMEVKQMDVETAFLNAPMREEVYMKQHRSILTTTRRS